MRARYDIAAVTNDIDTREDAEFLTRSGALPPGRITGVETGGCPHTAIREDASINLAAMAEMHRRHPDLDLLFIESGGDDLAATFSQELADTRAAGRRRSRRHGSRRAPDAGESAVPVHQPQGKPRRVGNRRLHCAGRWAGVRRMKMQAGRSRLCPLFERRPETTPDGGGEESEGKRGNPQ
jgi:hypothetical protein